MKAVVFSFTQAGTALGCRVAAHLRGEGWDVRQASLKKFAVVQEGVLPFTPNLHDEAARAFEAARLVVFIGASIRLIDVIFFTKTIIFNHLLLFFV